MREKTTARSKGLFASVTGLAVTLVAIAHTRLELLSADLEQERAYIFSLLTMSLAILFCLGTGLVLGIIAVVIAFWDTHRILAISTVAGFFLSAGTAIGLFALYKIKTRPGLLAASLAELSKDLHHLASRS